MTNRPSSLSKNAVLRFIEIFELVEQLPQRLFCNRTLNFATATPPLVCDLSDQLVHRRRAPPDKPLGNGPIAEKPLGKLLDQFKYLYEPKNRILG